MRLYRAKWWPFQPRNVVMAPDGNIWFHPAGAVWRDDFGQGPPSLQALLIHELTHVWQHQRGIFLPLRRHPFCRYAYTLVPGKPLQAYGIEQQASIVQHAFEARWDAVPATSLLVLLRDAGLVGEHSLVVRQGAVYHSA